ncbi:MAG: IPTL-CTERM sorting domain-containing protein [Deltaproteobacteria bacterium]|nr:IPTL-CTERM sorting domain-containing protein [Deltaproteobacteria bacterium]
MAKKKVFNIHMKRRFSVGACLLIALAFLVLPFSQATAATVVIDDMSVTQGSSASPELIDCNPAGPALQAGISGSAAHMVGGARIIEITHTAGDAPCTKSYVDDGTPSAWIVVNDTNAVGWGRAVWSGSATDIDNYGLNLDFCALEYFNFTWVKADHPTTYTFRVYNNAGQGSEATIAFPTSDTKENVHLAKADFAAIGGLAAVDWCAPITRISLQFTPYEDIDIGVREIQAITAEPAMSCEKSFDHTAVTPGDTVTATVLINNNGDIELTSVNVTDTLDTGLLYVAGTARVNGVLTEPTGGPAGPLVWNGIGPIAVSGTLTLTYDILVDSINPNQTLCNSVDVVSVDFPDLTTDCEDCVTYTTHEVPTFTQWGIIGFALLLSIGGFWLMRRRESMNS